MNLRRLPLWLVCDVASFVGVMISFWIFFARFSEATARLEKDPRCAKADFPLLAHLLAAAEAMLEHAILRRAFKLAGLRPGEVRIPDFMPARHRRSFCRRLRAYLDAIDNLTVLAARRAKRLRQLKDAELARLYLHPANTSADFTDHARTPAPFTPSWALGIPAPP